MQVARVGYFSLRFLEIQLYVDSMVEIPCVQIQNGLFRILSEYNGTEDQKQKFKKYSKDDCDLPVTELDLESRLGF